jgi:hypothetical protein
MTNTHHQHSKSKHPSSNRKSIAVIGGGASGIFAAIHASSSQSLSSPTSSSLTPRIDVTVFEATAHLLSKVKISGGGRCNVLHDATIPTEIILQKGYPRGFKELRSVCTQQFPISKAAQWFELHNVTLKTEADGRMFPITDSSQTVIDALLHTAIVENKVQVQLRTKISQILPPSNSCSKFQLIYFDSMTNQNNNDKIKSTAVTQQEFDAVIVATGSAPAGYALVAASSETRSSGTAQFKSTDSDFAAISPAITVHDNASIGNIQHPFVPSVPSLFTFNCKHAVSSTNDGILAGLAGVSVPKVRVTFLPAATLTKVTESDHVQAKSGRKKTPAHLTQEGPLLVTHLGLSGPAILRLSAFAARDMALCHYRGNVTINWVPDLFPNQDECFNALWATTFTNPKKMIASQCPILLPSTSAQTATLSAIPKRLWQSLVRSCGIPESLCWGNVNKQLIRKLAEQLMACQIEVTSKSTNKEEFVTAGGVDLSSINMKTMQSKGIPGLFFCGELLNVDGVTGGFNFYNCWSTGYVAGISAALYVQQQLQVK